MEYASGNPGDGNKKLSPGSANANKHSQIAILPPKVIITSSGFSLNLFIKSNLPFE